MIKTPVQTLDRQPCSSSAGYFLLRLCAKAWRHSLPRISSYPADDSSLAIGGWRLSGSELIDAAFLPGRLFCLLALAIPAAVLEQPGSVALAVGTEILGELFAMLLPVGPLDRGSLGFVCSIVVAHSFQDCFPTLEVIAPARLSTAGFAASIEPVGESAAAKVFCQWPALLTAGAGSRVIQIEETLGSRSAVREY